MVEVALKRPPEPEPDNPEPPADLAAHEQWLARMRELGRRTLGTLLEELKNSKIENAKPGRPFLSLDAALHSKQSRGHKERKSTLNYCFSHHEVTMMRLALGVALRQFEDCRDGEAPQMLAYINQPSWSEASQAARTMIERLSVPGVVVMINAPPNFVWTDQEGPRVEMPHAPAHKVYAFVLPVWRATAERHCSLSTIEFMIMEHLHPDRA